MVKHTQTIHQLFPTICLNMFDHFVGLALKGLIYIIFDQCDWCWWYMLTNVGACATVFLTNLLFHKKFFFYQLT